MNEEIRKQQILRVLARSVRKLIQEVDFARIQEIRLRVGKPLIVVQGGQEYILPEDGMKEWHAAKGNVTENQSVVGAGMTEAGYLVTKEEIRETLEYISHYSLYAFEKELRQGFITIEGGHRVGVTGKAVMEDNRIKNLQYISSINIRMAHEILGCADKVLPFITGNSQVYHTLVISPPGCGKTTLIRDLVRQISGGNQYVKGCTVGVVDERSEIGGCYLGVAQNQMGMRTDILDCCPKAEGMIMLIRSMAPQVIVVDEIGSSEEVHAVEYAMQCGCKLIASVHGASMEEAFAKPVLGQMLKKRRFERYVVLGNERGRGEISAIYDERGSLLCRG